MRKLVAGPTLAILLAACGGGEGPTAAGSSPAEGHHVTGGTCEPSGTALEITAKVTAFDDDCLAAPEGAAFTIAFDNRDGFEHNVAIFSGDPAENPNAKNLFRGEVFAGPKTVTYDVPALQKGEYHFHCDVHPDQMFGTFVVK